MNKFIAAWTAWFFVTMFYAYQYILRVLPNVGMPNIIKHFDINMSHMGRFSAVYYIGYTLLHIPVGLLIDRFSAKKMLPICVLITSIGLIPLVYSDSFTAAIIGRFFIGIASSASVIGIFKVVKMGFGESKFTSLVGMSVTIGLLGAIYGGRPLDYLVIKYGWECIINALMIVGCTFATLLYFVMPNHKDDASYHFSLNEMLLDVKYIFTNKRVLLLSFIGGLMVGPLEGFADAWGTLFFESSYGLDRSHASSLPSTIFFGMCFGSTLIGYVTDKTKAHITIVILSNMIMLASFSLIFLIKCNIYILYSLMFIIGLMSSYQISILGKVRDYTSSRIADLTSAGCNMIMMIFGTVFHTIIGAIVDTYESIQHGLFIIPVALFIALLLLIFAATTKFFIQKA